MAWGDVMQALPLKLKSNNPPDIVPANNGWQSLGTLVQGGLVLNLDRYAEAYGWRNAVPSSILAEHEFSTDGKTMGTGSLYGMPVARSSMIEVYYDRALLQHLGLDVPKTSTTSTPRWPRPRPRRSPRSRWATSSRSASPRRCTA